MSYAALTEVKQALYLALRLACVLHQLEMPCQSSSTDASVVQVHQSLKVNTHLAIGLSKKLTQVVIL
ncbi:hypothetical protein [Nostoc sp.]|uniref:hypothetical protein n=1 Tax=Nostoc sp. TaxID=1180 RepID=UPI002FFA09E9